MLSGDRLHQLVFLNCDTAVSRHFFGTSRSRLGLEGSTSRSRLGLESSKKWNISSRSCDFSSRSCDLTLVDIPGKESLGLRTSWFQGPVSDLSLEANRSMKLIEDL